MMVMELQEWWCLQVSESSTFMKIAIAGVVTCIIIGVVFSTVSIGLAIQKKAINKPLSDNSQYMYYNNKTVDKYTAESIWRFELNKGEVIVNPVQTFINDVYIITITRDPNNTIVMEFN